MTITGEEKQMKKWQITLTAAIGSLVVLFIIGFIMCEVIF
jgi:hypothetical protein